MRMHVYYVCCGVRSKEQLNGGWTILSPRIIILGQTISDLFGPILDIRTKMYVLIL